MGLVEMTLVQMGVVQLGLVQMDSLSVSHRFRFAAKLTQLPSFSELL